MCTLYIYKTLATAPILEKELHDSSTTGPLTTAATVITVNTTTTRLETRKRNKKETKTKRNITITPMTPNITTTPIHTTVPMAHRPHGATTLTPKELILGSERASSSIKI